MKKYLLAFLFFLLNMMWLTVINKIQAVSVYSIDQVQLHKTQNDCWMVINKQVYDLSNYLPNHDRYLNIRDWCGQDATQDYNTKAGLNKAHSLKADEMLKAYVIGELGNQQDVLLKNNEQQTETITLNVSENKIQSPDPELASKYQVYIPVLLTIIIYLVTRKFLKKAIHDFLWNSVLVLGTIPVIGFGFILALADQLPLLAKINFTQMLNQHAQLSIVVGTAMILHFLKRLKIYLFQGKAGLKINKKVSQ